MGAFHGAFGRAGLLMYARRRAKRRDENEGPIIAAMLAAGATVLQLDEIDLLVGFRGLNILIEVKNPAYGQAAEVETPNEALAVLMEVAKCSISADPSAPI
jgi:hypothetical protein